MDVTKVIFGLQPSRVANELLRFWDRRGLASGTVIVLALNTWSRCVSNNDGLAVYEQFNENRLEILPDILARRGAMCPEGPNEWM
jgi:hypothetical protein